MKSAIIAFSGLLLLLGGGCMAPTSGQYDRIARQLEDINRNLLALTRSYEDYNRLLAAAEQNAVEAGSDAGSRENLYMLRRIRKLPDNPTDQQIRQYVEKILVAAGNGYYPEDSLPFQMLKAIGPGHLEVLLPFLKGNIGVLLLEQALPELVAPGDKTLVLENLKEIPLLSVAAIRRGWGNDAKNEIFAILEDGKYRSRLIPYVRTLAQTPADRERIVDLYINQVNSSGLYPLIREFPDIDLLNINNRAWAKQKNGADAAKYAMRAAETGNVEALGYLINGYFEQDREGVFDGADILLIKLTGLPLDRETMCQWYQKNKDKLYIDEKSGRFSMIE